MISRHFKKTFVLFFALVLLSVVQAKEFKVYKNYEIALKEAKKSNKNLMMMLHSPHCPWCNKYRDTYPKKFQSNMIPTIFLIDSKNENENYKMLGFQTVESFIDEVSLAEDL